MKILRVVIYKLADERNFNKQEQDLAGEKNRV
jgi:hypothetical protein